MKKIYITPELEVISDVEPVIMAGSDKPGDSIVIFGGGDTGTTDKGGGGVTDTDEDLEMGAKGGYTAWGANWDYDEF